MRVRADIVSPTYLRLVWNSRVLRDQIESAAHTTAGIWKISQANLESFVVPVPAPDEQRETVRRAEELLMFAEHVESRYRVAQDTVDKLTSSLLAKAFRGELVSTEAELARQEERDYESAIELVHRIKSERQVTSGTESRRLRIRSKPLGNGRHRKTG